MQKVSKASVRYRPADLPDVRCGTCVMFHPDGTCDLVAGSIAASHVCDRWEPRHRIPSGHTRENTATQAARTVLNIWLAAEQAILAALAHWVMKVVTGGLLAILGLRRLRQAVTLIIHQAQEDTRQALAGLNRDVRASAERVIREDLAALPAGGAPPSPSSLERLHPPGIPLSVLERAVAEAMTGPAAPEWRSLPSLLHQAGMNVLRSTDDIYRAVIARAMAAAPGDRVEAAQKALDGFAAQGVSGFTDSLGRRWNIASYVEMAVRTAASRLHLALQLRAVTAAGSDLVLIVHSGATPPCPKCVPWVGRVLSISGMTPTGSDVAGEEVAGSISEAVAAGLFHPSCFPGGVLTSAPSGVRTAYSVWYEGDLVVIHTAHGDELPVTPNHPVLTPDGWVAAGQLKQGQDLLRYHGGDEGMDAPLAGMRPDDELIPARISDVFDALHEASPVASIRVPASAEQFHGDGGGSDVHVVFADGLLKNHRNAQGLRYGAFIGSDSDLSPFLRLSGGLELGVAGLGAPDGIMGGRGQRFALCPAHAAEAAAHSFAGADLRAGFNDYALHGHSVNAELISDGLLRQSGSVEADDLVGLLSGGLQQTSLLAQVHAGRMEPAVESVGTYAEAGSDSVAALTRFVTPDRIVKIERRSFAGHVYDLQTGDGWYVANGIVVHNCRCSPVPFTDGAVIPPVAPSPARDYEAEQAQRRHERAVRRETRRRSVAATPLARRAAKMRLAHVRARGLQPPS